VWRQCQTLLASEVTAHGGPVSDTKVEATKRSGVFRAHWRQPTGAWAYATQ